MFPVIAYEHHQRLVQLRWYRHVVQQLHDGCDTPNVIGVQIFLESAYQVGVYECCRHGAVKTQNAADGCFPTDVAGCISPQVILMTNVSSEKQPTRLMLVELLEILLGEVLMDC